VRDIPKGDPLLRGTPSGHGGGSPVPIGASAGGLGADYGSGGGGRYLRLHEDLLEGFQPATFLADGIRTSPPPQHKEPGSRKALVCVVLTSLLPLSHGEPPVGSLRRAAFLALQALERELYPDRPVSMDLADWTAARED